MGKKRIEDAPELDLVPIMNMVTILIPFLLMAAQFITLSVIDSTLPAIGGAPPPDATPPERPPLNLKVLVTSEGFTIATDVAVLPAQGNAGPTVPCKAPGCPTIDAYDFEQLTRLLSEIKDEYGHEENVILVPENHIRYEVLIKTMDATREDPNQKVETDAGPKNKELFPFVVIAGGA
jgi:biopolymer transport protein ExbD